LEEIADLLRAEHGHLRKFGEILDNTSNGLNRPGLLSRDFLVKIASVISTATASTLSQGDRLASTLNDKSLELESVKSKLEEYKRLADTDPLTHVWNRRAFDRRLSEIYDSSKGILFSALVLVDIDRFKEVNDRYGHPAGDRILQGIAQRFRSSVGGKVFVARTGGEEFAFVIEGMSEDRVHEIADRIRVHIETTPFTLAQSDDSLPIRLTISMGLCMASEAQSPDEFYAKADKALYRSKLDGRNTVTRHSALHDKKSKNWLLYRAE
jgi:diguanylate cyclase